MTASASAPLAASIAALRTRYLGTADRTVAAVRELGARLAAAEAAPTGATLGDATRADDRAAEDAALAGQLRRELHRVRGTAGTYGLTAVADVCAAAEERVARWTTDRAADAGARAAAVAALADALAAAFRTDGAAGDAGTAPGSADPAPVPAPAPDPAPAPAHAPVGAVVPPIVVVEDDDDLAEMLALSLDTMDVPHERYADGPSALAALLALPPGRGRPVVLLDVDLPGMDGHTVHESLRAARPRGAEVVFMTAHAAEHEQVRAFQAGALDYVVKPVSLRVLLAKLPVWQRAAAA
jgi:CheY-like chemotaxis protein/HPt (histidine-containing phosphotransfer) domain-containing protein